MKEDANLLVRLALPPLLLVLAAGCQLAISGGGNGSGRVEVRPGDAVCMVNAGATSGACVHEFVFGQAVVLEAVADEGSVFEGWSGECQAVSESSCSVNMTANRAITASFRLLTFSLSVRAEGSGGGQVVISPGGPICYFGSDAADCSAVKDYGTAVTLVAAAQEGSRFDSWSGCDGTNGSTCTVTLKSDRVVVVRFLLAPTPTPTVAPPTPTPTQSPSGPATASLSPSSIKLGSASSITFTGTLRNFPPNTELTASYTYSCSIPGCSGSGTLSETVTTDASGGASATYTVTGIPTQTQICAAALLNPEYRQYLGTTGTVTVTFSGGGKQASASLTISLPTRADCNIS